MSLKHFYDVKIFPATATNFGSGGEVLTDIVSSKTTHVIGGAYDLTAQYPINGEHAEDIKPEAIIYAADPVGTSILHGTNITYQPFRIYRTTRTMDGIITVYAHHISYDLGRVTCRPFEGTYTRVVDAVNAIVNSAQTGNEYYPLQRFSWGIEDYNPALDPSIQEPILEQFYHGTWTSPNKPMTLRALMADLIKGFPTAFWWFDGWDVTLQHYFYMDPDLINFWFKVRLGKNMLSLKRDVNNDQEYTQILGYYHDTYNGTEYKLYSDPVPTGATAEVIRTGLLDLTSDYDTPPTVADLTAAVTNRINEFQATTETIETTFWIDDWTTGYGPQTELRLGYPVHVINDELGVDQALYLTKTVTDNLRALYDTVTVGTIPKNLAQVLMQIGGRKNG